jgi:hypothetical protein
VTRQPVLAALALTAALGAALAGTTAAAGTAAAPSSHRPTATADRGTPGHWTKVSSGSIGIHYAPSLTRTSDGVLQLVYAKGVAADHVIGHTAINTNGSIAEQDDVFDTGWMDLDPAPVVFSEGGSNLRIVFGGNDGLTDFWSHNRMYTATGSGGTWALPAEAVGINQGAASSAGTAGVALADGTPVAAWAFDDTVHWHVGTDASADGTVGIGPCCISDAALVRDGGSVWLAWYSSGAGNAAMVGTFVMRIYPTVGTPMKAPGSSVGADTVDTGRVALAARVGGGVYTAYCVGFPTCTSIRVWKVGTNKTASVPQSRFASPISLSPGPSGRLWVAWADNAPRIRAVRTDPTGLTFGAVQDAGLPQGGATHSLAIDGTVGRGDIVLNDGNGMWHTQVLAGLTLKAAPASWRHHTRQKVTFTVTDAHDAVRGAKVTVGRSHCTTSARGTCTITFAPSYARGKHTARATKSGQASATAVLKVR